MEYAATAKSIKAAQQDLARSVVATDIDGLSRDNFLRNMPSSLATAIIPFAMLALCCLQISQWHVMAALLLLHGGVLGAMLYLSRRILAARSAMRKRILWQSYTFLSGLSGVLWAACMLPVATSLGQDIAAMFVCIVIIVSVTVTAMVIATQWSAFLAFLSGFMACLLPQAVVYLGVIGPIPLIATLGLAPALIGLARVVRKQDRDMLTVQLERQLLADDLSRALATAEYLANRDSLTGLYNRRAFETVAEQMRARHPSLTHTLILIDLDHFKSVNDRFGHAVGDAVLTRTAKVITQGIGRQGLVGRGDGATARWGGEEFIVLLQGGRADDASTIARRLRAQMILMRDPAWPAELIITASFGVATWHDDIPLHLAISQADCAMYEAKRAGRDRIHIHGAVPGSPMPAN